MIAGDDGLLFTSRNNVLIGCGGQRAQKISAARRRLLDSLASFDLNLAICVGMLRVARFGRGNNAKAYGLVSGKCGRVNREPEREWTEKIFMEIQPSLLLNSILEVSIPETVCLNLSRFISKMQCRKIRIGGNTHPAFRDFDTGIQSAVFVRGAVVIAKRNQRPNFEAVVQAVSFRGVRPAKLILHNCRVFALHHEHRFLDLDSISLVSEDGKWIEPKASLQLEALWVNCSRVLVSREVVTVVIDAEGFFQFGKQKHATDRRLRCRGQEAVIAPSVKSDDR